VAATALSRAWELRDRHADFHAWWFQLRSAVACSPTPQVLLRALQQVFGACRQASRLWFRGRPTVGREGQDGQPHD
jgi:hypothetical protein